MHSHNCPRCSKIYSCDCPISFEDERVCSACVLICIQCGADISLDILNLIRLNRWESLCGNDCYKKLHPEVII